MSGSTNPEPLPDNGSMVPPGILDAAFAVMKESGILDEECLLRKVETDTGVEWWLMDDHGELIEVFWLEQDNCKFFREENHLYRHR